VTSDFNVVAQLIKRQSQENETLFLLQQLFQFQVNINAKRARTRSTRFAVMEQLIRPRKSSHPSNIQSNGYVPPVEALDSAFCNSFWIQADKRALPGSDPSELGAEGYNTIMQRMKNGSKTLEELRTFLRERLVE
jgi:hypothetical protein